MYIVLSEIFPPTHGGSGRWLWEVAKRQDPQTFAVIAHHHPNAESFDQSHNLDVRRTALQSPEWGLRSRKGLHYYWRTLRYVRRVIKETKATSLHCARCLPEGFVGYLMYRVYHTPYICFVHGEDIEAAKQSRELSWIVHRSLNGAQRLICNSHNTAQLLMNDWSVPNPKIHVIHPGVDTTFFTPAERSLTVRERLDWGNRPVLLTVGRLQRRKGHDKVIEALPRILNKHPDLLYSIIGRGEELQRLEDLAHRYGVTSSVQFITNASDEDLRCAYQQCDLFILANRTEGNDIEGFGMVLAEAQACGKPVIAGDSGGTREAMIEGKTGWIIDCTSAENIAKAVIARLDNIQADGTSQREFVVNALDWEVHVRKLEEALETVAL